MGQSGKESSYDPRSRRLQCVKHVLLLGRGKLLPPACGREGSSRVRDLILPLYPLLFTGGFSNTSKGEVGIEQWYSTSHHLFFSQEDWEWRRIYDEMSSTICDARKPRSAHPRVLDARINARLDTVILGTQVKQVNLDLRMLYALPRWKKEPASGTSHLTSTFGSK